MGWGLTAKGAACPGALQLREQSEVSGESSGGGRRGQSVRVSHCGCPGR